MEHVDYPSGAVIFLIGDPSTTAYLIHSGKVELRGGSRTDNDPVLLGPGDVFGEISLIEERPHLVSARVMSPARISPLTRAEFDHAMTAVPETVRSFIRANFRQSQRKQASIDRSVSILPTFVSGFAVTLHPLTPLAAAAVPAEGLPITRFPFRIGRIAAENEARPTEINDLWLEDQAPYHVSRNHALIDLLEGKVVLKDRGSSLGILVNEVSIGGRELERHKVLDEGDNYVMLGGQMSPFQYRVNVVRR